MAQAHSLREICGGLAHPFVVGPVCEKIGLGSCEGHMHRSLDLCIGPCNSPDSQFVYDALKELLVGTEWATV